MSSKTIEALRSLEKDFKPDKGTEVFIVGGFVRDLLRKKQNKDIDVVVRNITLEEVKNYLSKHGKVKELSIHHIKGAAPIKFVSFTAHDDTLEAQIALTRGHKKGAKPGTGTLLKDSKFRDFTINAMYLPISTINPKKVIDYVGGKNDITAKQVLSVGNAAHKFRMSPIRIMRAFSLSARTGYKLSNHVKHAIKDCANLLKKVPGEPIRHELEEILMSSKPSVQLKQMQSLGVLKVILPELDKCFNCTQDKKHHKYDVFTHLIYTCDNADADLILRLAGLLHDIGKPESRKEIGKDKVTFYLHEVVGAKIATNILRRLKYSEAIIKEVTHLIRMHMYHYTRDYTDAGVRRFIIKAGIEKHHLDNLSNFPLFKLRQAERLGNGFKKNPITPRQKDFQDRITRVFNESSGLTIKDLAINGNDVMSLFRIDPGPEIGKLLKKLIELVLEDPDLNDRKVLLHFVLDLILGKQEKGEEGSKE
jgi:poly(A) polymerase/tRNA nucleotidyltransferase (CCA-adding enzyme)